MWAMLMLWLLPANAQQAKQYFVSMPDTILPLLTEINRADCIDFLESNMRAIVTNRLDGKSEMTTLTDNYIAIKLSEQSSWQMKVLALNDSTQVICTVFTAYIGRDCSLSLRHSSVTDRRISLFFRTEVSF